MQTLNINFFGGPGIGKSASAERLSARLRERGHSVELVREYSKDLHWEGRLHGTEQFLITSEQWHRQARVQGKAPLVITDSAVPLGLLHAPPSYREPLEAVVRALMQDWRCFDVLVERDLAADYSNLGRDEPLEAALAHQQRVRELFARHARPGMSAVLNLDTSSALDDLVKRLCGQPEAGGGLLP